MRALCLLALAAAILVPAEAAAKCKRDHHGCHRHRHDHAPEKAPRRLPPGPAAATFVERWGTDWRMLVPPILASGDEFASLTQVPRPAVDHVGGANKVIVAACDPVEVERRPAWWEFLLIPAAAVAGAWLALLLLVHGQRRRDQLMFEDPDDAVRRWHDRVVDAVEPRG